MVLNETIKNNDYNLNIKVENDKALKDKINICGKEIRNLKEENKINKNKVNYQKLQINDLNKKISKKDKETKLMSEN